MSLRGLLLALAMTSLVFAGCISESGNDEDSADAATDPMAGRLAPDAWRAMLSEPVYDTVTTTVHYLEAEDGTQLSLSVTLPDGLEEGAKIPTLMELTPYQSFIFPHMSTPITGTATPSGAWTYVVERGAAFVRADARGTNGSDGCLDFGGSKDRSDARVFAKWVQEQEWSNGVIVMDGVSHPGMGAVVAHAAVPELTASLAVAPVVSYYQDEWLQGAKFEDQLNGAAYQAVELSPPVYAHPEGLTSQAAPCTGTTTVDYSVVDGPFTDYWADRDLSLHVEDAIAARTPIVLQHGFVDQNVHPDHTQKYWDALPDDYPKHLVMGWWYHARPDFEQHPFEDDADVRARFFDAALFGIDNGFWDEPRVLVEDSQGTWHESENWPLDPSEAQLWHPTADGALDLNGTDTSEVSYPDLADAPTRGHWTDTHVAFRSEPLDKAMLVNGAPKLHLVASSSEAETKWVAYLLDEAPDGSWQRITHGYADSHSHGEPHEWLDMEPGTPYVWTLELMPTAVVVEEGHRVTLLITSQDSRNNPNNEPYCFSDYRGGDKEGCHNPSGILPASTAGRAENTVYLGPDGTSLSFDWVDPALTQKVPWSVA